MLAVTRNLNLVTMKMKERSKREQYMELFWHDDKKVISSYLVDNFSTFLKVLDNCFYIWCLETPLKCLTASIWCICCSCSPVPTAPPSVVLMFLFTPLISTSCLHWHARTHARAHTHTHTHIQSILGRRPAAAVRVTNDPFHSTNTT